MEMEMGPEDVEKGRKTALALRAKDLLVGYSTNHIRHCEPLRHLESQFPRAHEGSSMGTQASAHDSGVERQGIGLVRPHLEPLEGININHGKNR